MVKDFERVPLCQRLPGPEPWRGILGFGDQYRFGAWAAFLTGFFCDPPLTFTQTCGPPLRQGRDEDFPWWNDVQIEIRITQTVDNDA